MISISSQKYDMKLSLHPGTLVRPTSQCQAPTLGLHEADDLYSTEHFRNQLAVGEKTGGV